VDIEPNPVTCHGSLFNKIHYVNLVGNYRICHWHVYPQQRLTCHDRTPFLLVLHAERLAFPCTYGRVGAYPQQQTIIFMKLASIETIKEIRSHSNADRLEIATILGWQSVVKKGEFKAGDKVVFIVIDTILPSAPWSEFLADKKNPDKPIRLRTVKLRGEFSQGLVLPITVLPPHVQDWQEGADVGGELQIRKFEKEVPAQLSGIAKCTFPRSFAPRTDEDNGLSNPELVEAVTRHMVDITLKLDGSSCTIIVDQGKIIHVCSRNMSLVESNSNAFWIAAKKLLIPSPFTGVIQGELMGPGIQGNQLELSEPTLYVFQISQNGKWMELHRATAECELMDVPHVPIVIQAVGGSQATEAESGVSIDSLQDLADSQTLPNGKPAEGIVVRPIHMPSSSEGRPLSFKIINRNYGE